MDRSALVFEHLQVIQHGACLGLGIAALGTCDEEAFEDVKNVLYMDNAGGWLCCSCMAQVGMAGLLIRFGRQLAFELALLTYVLKHPPTNTHTLPTECAVAGEAAGLALGLLYAGSGTDKAAELLAYAHETQVRWASAAAWAGMRCSVLRCCLSWHVLQPAVWCCFG